jgi:hypothetical protein
VCGNDAKRSDRFTTGCVAHFGGATQSANQHHSVQPSPECPVHRGF